MKKIHLSPNVFGLLLRALINVLLKIKAYRIKAYICILQANLFWCILLYVRTTLLTYLILKMLVSDTAVAQGLCFAGCLLPVDQMTTDKHMYAELGANSTEKALLISSLKDSGSTCMSKTSLVNSPVSGQSSDMVLEFIHCSWYLGRVKCRDWISLYNCMCDNKVHLNMYSNGQI